MHYSGLTVYRQNLLLFPVIVATFHKLPAQGLCAFGLHRTMVGVVDEIMLLKVLEKFLF